MRTVGRRSLPCKCAGCRGSCDSDERVSVPYTSDIVLDSVVAVAERAGCPFRRAALFNTRECRLLSASNAVGQVQPYRQQSQGNAAPEPENQCPFVSTRRFACTGLLFCHLCGSQLLQNRQCGAIVVGSRRVLLDAPIAVYNLEVAGAHTDFVEDGQGDQSPLWVHNDCYNRGGAFSVLNRIKTSGEVAHHMPQNAARLTSRARGPALGMSIADHELTRTMGWRGAITNAAESTLTPRQRLSRDIADVRKLFGRKYDQGIRELLAYAKTLSVFRK